jgi:hypothetical protein
MSLHVVFPRPQGLIETGDGFIDFTKLQENHTKMVVGLGVVRLQGDGSLEGGAGFPKVLKQ